MKRKSTQRNKPSIDQEQITNSTKCLQESLNENDNDNLTTDNMEIENISGDIEYTKTLKNALRDAINQNEKLLQDLSKLIEDNENLKKEIKDKDNVIYELSQYYQYCQTNHLNKKPRKERSKKSIKNGKKRKVSATSQNSPKFNKIKLKNNDGFERI